VWDLDDRNDLHVKAKKKLLAFLGDPQKVRLGSTAERDLSITPVRKLGLLQSMSEFIGCGAVLKGDFMQQTGDEAFIFEYCQCDGIELYVKASFKGEGRNESLFIFSAHPTRRW
jgi:hypothetical protein